MADKHGSAASKRTPQAKPGAGQTDGEVTTLDTIATAIARLDAKLDSSISEVKNDLNSKFDEVLGKIAGMEKSLDFAHNELTDVKEKNHTIEADNKRLKSELEKCQRDTERLEITMKERLNEIERRSREYNIRIHGLLDNKGEKDHRKLVAKTLVENKLLPEGRTVEHAMGLIEIAHPLQIKGQYIAKLYSRPCKNSIIREAKTKLNRESGKEGLKVFEDFTKMDYDRKQRASPQMRAAFEAGKKVRFQRGRLIIDGKNVAIEDD